MELFSVGWFLRILLFHAFAKTCQSDYAEKVPRGLNILSTTSTSVVLQWEPPQDQSDGLGSFSVEYYSVTAASGAVQGIPVGVLQYALTNLEPFTLYTVRVASVYYGNERHFSESVNVTTQEDVPEEPKSLSAVAGPMWARLAWQPPEKPNGVVLYYQVVVKETSLGSTTAALQFNVTGSRTEFTVTPLTPYTCYSYFVTAATAVGAGAQTNKEFFCTEQYKSSAPESLQVVDTGPHSALLRWETPSHPNGVIVSYHIRYQRGLADEALSYETNTSSIDASYLLADLLPSTTYTVTVAAINGAGIGLFSEEQGFMTTAPILGAPAEFQAIAVSATVVSLMWGPPLEYGNLVREYVIEFHKHGEIPQQIYLSADTMHYAIVGLAPHTEYKFKVRAVSENGNGSWTSEVTVKTHEGKSSPPLALNATLLSPTSVSLNWSPPLAPLGIVISYTVHIVEGNSSNRTLSTGHNWTELVVTDLYPGEEYSFTVAAVNGMGEGLQSSAVNTSTPLPVLPPPGAPSVMYVNSTSVTLQWGLPREFPQFVLSYVLQCSSQSQLAPVHAVTYTTTQTHTTVHQLAPYTEYAFAVAIVSGAGQGEWSNTTWLRTDAFIPMPVEGLQAINVSSKVVELTWDPPTHSNGPITNYFLYWSSDGVSPDSHMTIPPDVHQFVLQSLVPHTEYNIAVCVANIAGRSENRSLTVLTPQAVSGPPENFKVTNVTPTSLSLSWDPPLNPGGPVFHFVLHTSDRRPLLAAGLSATVKDLQPFSVYNVTVQAVNGLGPGAAASISARTGEGKSSSPVFLRIIQVTSSSISLQWEEPENVRGVLDHYLVFCEAGFSHKLVEAESSAKGIVLTNMTHATTYTISVAGVNGRGIGEWTRPIMANTTDEISSPPTSIKTVNVTATTIILSWQPPEHPGGTVHGYQVTVNGTVYVTLPWQHTLHVTNLTPGSEYTIVIQALNGIGGRELSEFFVATLDPVLSAPVRLRLVDVGPRHVALDWMHPYNFTHTLTHYNIHYSSESWGEVGVVHINSTSSMATLYNLEEATLYAVHVSAVNGAGPGLPATLLVETLSDVPSDTPKNLSVLEMSSSSVTLTWVAPPLVEQNGYLTGYSVNYSTGAGPWHTVRRVKESRITLSGLQPHKEVVVSVAAVNVNGTGPYTVPLALQTPANTTESGPTAPPPTTTTTSGCINCTPWQLVALLTTGILMSLIVVAGLLMGRYCSRRLQEFKLPKISRTSSRKQNYETQEAVIDTSTSETTAAVSSLHPSVSSHTQKPSSISFPSLTQMPLRSSFSDSAIMNQEDSGYVGTSLDQLAVEGPKQSVTSF